jgi:hypothetical protein
MAFLGTFTNGQVLTSLEMNQLNGATFLSSATIQAVGTGANVTVTFASPADVVINPGGWFVDATDRITPTVAGVYVVGSTVNLSANAGAISYLTNLKNGATIVSKNTSNLATSGANSSHSTFGLVSMNGSTDYLNAVVFQSSGGSINITSKTFYAYLLRKT